MKIRAGFVSNSSSTSFTFCFKGDKEDLFTVIRNHKDNFSLSYDRSWTDEPEICSCNYHDIIDTLDDFIGRHTAYEWDSVNIIDVDEKIEELEGYRFEEQKSLNRKDEECWMKEYVSEHIDHLTCHINTLKRAKGRGLTKMVEIGFGDNHGQVCGGSLGYVMDYEGRRINIEESDLFVFSEQDR